MSYNKLSNIMTGVMESYDFVITLYVTDWLRITKGRNKKSEKSEDLPDFCTRIKAIHFHQYVMSSCDDPTKIENVFNIRGVLQYKFETKSAQNQHWSKTLFAVFYPVCKMT